MAVRPAFKGENLCISRQALLVQEVRFFQEEAGLDKGSEQEGP